MSKKLPKLVIGYGCVLVLLGIVRSSIRPGSGTLSVIVGVSGGLLAVTCGVIALSKRNRHILVVLGVGIIGFALLGQASGEEAAKNDFSIGEVVISLVLGILAGLFLGSAYDSSSRAPKKKLPPQNHIWN